MLFGISMVAPFSGKYFLVPSIWQALGSIKAKRVSSLASRSLLFSWQMQKAICCEVAGRLKPRGGMKPSGGGNSSWEETPNVPRALTGGVLLRKPDGSDHEGTG